MALFHTLSVLATGLAFGAMAIPWKDSQWSNTSTLEYWIVWAVFWWALLPYLSVYAARWYLEQWAHYLARRRYEKSKP